MLLPAVALAFLFILLPILYSLGYAFTDYYLLRPNNINFIEIHNFKDFLFYVILLLIDRKFIKIQRNAITYSQSQFREYRLVWR